MKHILDWYNENTPQNEDEYEKGCLTSAAIIAIIFIALTVAIINIGNYIALCTKNYINRKFKIFYLCLRHVFNGATYNNS